MLANLEAWIHLKALGTEIAGTELERRRMYVLFAIALFKLCNFFGGTWDIQWHIFVGRDNLFIPPHLMVLVAFSGGIALASAWIAYETVWVGADSEMAGTVHIGPLHAPPAFFGVFMGYAGALLSGVFDEWWHRTYGIDSTLWSPPHLCIMASTMTVDYSLMIGIFSAARRLGARLEWRSPLLWGLAVSGAYLFEAVNFQMSQAFIEAYRVNGIGLMGILFPVLVGGAFPMPMLMTIRLAGRFRVTLLFFAVAFVLQLVGIGIAAGGFAVLQPVSALGEFVSRNPNSAIAQAGEFVSRIGFWGWVGFQQEWSLALSAVPLGLVSLLDALPWARRHRIVAAPLYSASLVIVSYLWFRQMPVMSDYAIAWTDVLLGVTVSVLIGYVFGRIGLYLGARVLAGETPVGPAG